MIKDVTNSPKDVNDFWYNSKELNVINANNNYNELVDYQVQSMNRFESLSDTMTEQSEAPFNTQAYENYKDQVKQYQLNTNGNLTEMILKLGFKLDQQLDKIIKQLDKIMEDK
tara:strand:- start:574 stop:912 length:339 start_codon:yes stop_codon:yes gene_type:complete